MKRLGMTILLAALAAGCQTAPTSRYGDVNDDIYGRKDTMEYTQKSRSVDEMLEAMLSDPDFTELYKDAMKRAKKRHHARPTVIVEEIEDNTHAGSNDFVATSQMRKELKVALRKTRMFRVIDLQERALMRKTVIADVDGGAADSNLQSIYSECDFTMRAELQKTPVGNSYFHFFDVLMTDTSTGEEAWNEVVRIRKD